jgi:hypothetical protein
MEVTTPHQLFRIINHIALLEQGRTYAWRGQNDSTWNLSASLYRRLAKDGSTVTENMMRDAELEILKEARRWGLGRDLGPSATDMHMLAVLQHHGVPTRLIDVTSNPMTALWFAVEEDTPDEDGEMRRSPGVLFAIDVTRTPWYETFQHGDNRTWAHMEDPLAATYKLALDKSKETKEMFRAFPALPDERMKAQEGFFIGSSVPVYHRVPGVIGFNPIGSAPGDEKLQKLLATERGQGRPANVPFCAIVIPAVVKDKIRDPLKHTYNRRRRVLFPDVDGFRDGFVRGQLD